MSGDQSVLDNQLDQHKKKVFQVLLYLTVPAGIIFAIINFARGHVFLSLIEILASVVAWVLLVRLKRAHSDQQIQRLSLVFVCLFFSTMSYAFMASGTSISIYVWAMVIPLLSYLLLGTRVGFYTTAIFLTVAALAFFSGTAGHPVVQEKVAYANIIFCGLLIWGISHSYEMANNKIKLKLSKQAARDYLTGLYNRSGLKRGFTQCADVAKKRGMPLGLVLLDLDRFKHINDECGHAIGDQVLIQFATLIKHHTPADGLAFRVGGEEFLIMFAESDELTAQSLAERIRIQTEEIKIPDSHRSSLTVSIGVTSNSDWQLGIEPLLKEADKRLYAAKNQGRNVVVHQGPKS